MKNVVSSNQGFSLIELMVVSAIIGILAAIAIPNFQRFSAKAKQAEAKTDLSGLFGAESSFFAEWSVYDQDMLLIGYRPLGFIRYRMTNATGSALPGNFPGGPGASIAANAVTSGFCGNNVVTATAGCGESISGGTGATAPVGATLVMTTGSGFTSAASSMLLNSPNVTADTWTVDQRKVFLNVNPGLP
jgi:prepilin-type N-terminal cleavage/methylation domain-containing protein